VEAVAASVRDAALHFSHQDQGKLSGQGLEAIQCVPSVLRRIQVDLENKNKRFLRPVYFSLHIFSLIFGSERPMFANSIHCGPSAELIRILIFKTE
jgi:hypothetical protein